MARILLLNTKDLSVQRSNPKRFAVSETHAPVRKDHCRGQTRAPDFAHIRP